MPRSCLCPLSLLWPLLALLSLGTSRIQPLPSSCQEQELCECHGTVYYGRKYLNANSKPGSGVVTSLDQMKRHTSSYQMKEVSGPYVCSLEAFHHDPAPELLDPPLCATLAQASSHPLRIAIGFYGISQNLRITLPTFKKHIFDVLQHHRAVYDVFASTALPDFNEEESLSGSSKHDKEESYESDEYDLRLLRPCAITLTPREHILHSSEQHATSSFSSEQRVMEYTRRSLRAMIFTFSRVHSVQYDAYLVLRPDTAVTSDLDLPQLLVNTQRWSRSHLYVPSIFDSQDRAAFGSPAVMALYLCGLGEMQEGYFVADETSAVLRCANDASRSVTTSAIADGETVSFPLPVKKSVMTIIGVKRDRRLPSYELLPAPSALSRRLCVRSSSSSARAGTSTGAKAPFARVAIGFYGLSRNLRLTLPSFKKHVFDVLERHNIAYDVFWSTVTAPVLVSNRSNEWSIDIDEYDVRLLRPCVTTLLPMYQVLNETEFDYSHISPHYHYKDGFSSVRNIFCSLRTQKVLASSIQTHSLTHGRYDAVATFRPDTAVVRDLDMAELLVNKKFSTKHIYLPNFAHFKGVNDRSAYGSPAVMFAYLNREEAFKISLATNTDRWIYNTETFLKNYLKEHKIPVHKSTVRVVRVRADGKIPAYDSNTVVMYMPKKEIERCQMSVTNASTGETFTVLDTTIC